MPRQDQSGLLKLHHSILILILILIQPGGSVAGQNQRRLLELHAFILMPPRKRTTIPAGRAG